MNLFTAGRCLAVLALSAVPAAAQVGLPRIDEVIEVRIINFDVIVTDALGNHIHGLTKDDFELYENGKRREITNLSEFTSAATEETAAQSAVAPPQRVVIFVDVFSTTTFERKRACDAIADFLKHLRPEDEVMLLSWNRAIKVVEPATHDLTRVKDALGRVAREASIGSSASRLHERMSTSNAAELRTVERTHKRIELANLLETANALNTILTRFAGVEGRKVLLMVTSGFGVVDAEQEYAREVTLAMESIERRANAGGISLYGVFAGGLDSGMSVEDTQPGYSETRGREASGSIDGLRYLAGRTGGSVAANTNYFKRGLESIARDLSSYYSIGYSANARRIDAQNEVEIRTRNASYTVRARRSFVERSFESEVADHVAAGLFFPAMTNDLGITAKEGVSARQGRNRYAVPIDIRIPYESLSFTPDERGYLANVSVFIGTADAKGGTSEVKMFRHEIRVTREKLGAIAGKSYLYGFDVDLRTEAGKHRVAVAVMDNVSKAVGYAAVDIAKLPGSR